MRNVRIDTEAGTQEMLMQVLSYKVHKYPELALLHHIPNGGKRNAAEAAHLKRQGVKAGVPDLHLPVARGGYHSLYVEMKIKGGTISKYQKEWIAELNKQGNLAVVCWDWEEAANTIIDYLELGVYKQADKRVDAETDADTLQPAT